MATLSITDAGDFSGADPVFDPPADQNPTLIGAMFRQTTTPGSVLSSNWLSERIFNHDPTPMNTDELLEAIDRDGFWGREDHFLEVRTRGMYSAIAADIRREEADREIISDSGVMATIGAGLLVAPLDPINWIPIGTFAKSAHTGATIAEIALRTSGAAGIATALQEPFLQVQHLRTADEAAWDMGASMVIGGVLGFGASATPVVANKAMNTIRKWAASDDWRERHLESLAKVWEQANNDILNNPQGRKVKGGGRLPAKGQLEAREEAFDALQSAAERQEAFKELSLANTGPFEWMRTAPGRLLSKVVGPQFRDPIDFVMKRAQSLEARKALEQIIEIPVALNKNFVGKPTAQAVTTEVDQFVGKWAEFRDAMMGGSLTETGKRVMGKGTSLFTEARKAGFAGGVDEFEKEITLAVVRGYTHANPAIEKASLMFKQVTDSIKDLAIKAGYDIKDADAVKFALGYAPRKYVVANVRGPDGQGTAFIARARKAYYDDILDSEFTSQGKTPTSQQLAGINKRSKTLSKQAFRRITREETEEGGLIQANIRSGNPQAERVLPIPDEELITNGWIDPRATDLLNVHVRQTVPALLLAQRFKSPTGLPDPNLRASLIPKIEKEYDTLATTVKSAEERAKLLEERDGLIYTFKTLADQIVHGTRVGSPNWSRRAMERVEMAVQATKLYQVMRLMGGLVMASVPDVANFQLRHGLARPLKAFVNDMNASGALNLATLKGMTPEAIASEAKRMGAATEWATNSDMAAHLDLLSPYQARNGFQRGMASMAKTFSVSNFSVWWNDTMKTRSFRVGMDRILEGAEKGFDNLGQMDRDFLAVLGLGKSELNRIGAAWRSQSQGLHDNFLRVAYASQWGDQEAARLLGNALAKDNASTVVRPRTGDKATFWNNPLVGLVTQFQNFASSHALRSITYAEQRVIRERGFGADSFRVYGGMMSMVALGMLSAYMYAVAKDAAKIAAGEAAPSVEKLVNNLGQWISLGLERSSILGMYQYYNSYWERLGNPGLTRPLQNMMGDESRQVDARGRWLDRDPGGVLLGPTLSQGFDATKLAGHWSRHMFDDRDFKRGDARTMREAMPFQNHILTRHLFDYIEKDGIGDSLLGIDDGR